MSIDRETLAAYAEGQLDGAERLRVEAAIAADPALADEVAAHRALGERLRAHFAPIMDLPVPDRLRDAVRPSAEVIDLRTIRPLDIETIVNSVRKTSRLVTCEEGFPFAGLGSEIAMQVMERAFDWLDAPIARVTGKDVPMPYAANLEKLALPQIEDITATVQATCAGFREA